MLQREGAEAHETFSRRFRAHECPFRSVAFTGTFALRWCQPVRILLRLG